LGLFAEVGIHSLQIPVEVHRLQLGIALVDRITVGLLGAEPGLALVGDTAEDIEWTVSGKCPSGVTVIISESVRLQQGWLAGCVASRNSRS